MTKPIHWIFDLDDTLYLESDYVASAFRFVSDQAVEKFGVDPFDQRIHAARAKGAPNPIWSVWQQMALPPDALPATINAMQRHVPTIGLRPHAASFLQRLRDGKRGYGIITDGRSVTQRAKIGALGCQDATFISVSEEAGLSKLDRERFVAAHDHFAPGHFCYVADNPAKDFLVPNMLGWTTIMIDNKGQGIHSQQLVDDDQFNPKLSIERFDDLMDLEIR